MKNILKKIDDLYSKLVEVIVGDIPTDDAIYIAQEKEKKYKKIQGLKHTFLTLGTPKKDELLYEEVIKKERREAKKAKALRKLAKLEKKTKKALEKKKSF